MAPSEIVQERARLRERQVLPKPTSLRLAELLRLQTSRATLRCLAMCTYAHSLCLPMTVSPALQQLECPFIAERIPWQSTSERANQRQTPPHAASQWYCPLSTTLPSLPTVRTTGLAAGR